MGKRSHGTCLSGSRSDLRDGRCSMGQERMRSPGSVLRNFFANGATYGSGIDPGDRKSGFDFRWHLPGIARWITIYSDFYADDEPLPITSFRRSAFNPGIYLSQLPGLRKWDLASRTGFHARRR